MSAPAWAQAPTRPPADPPPAWRAVVLAGLVAAVGPVARVAAATDGGRAALVGAAAAAAAMLAASVVRPWPARLALAAAAGAVGLALADPWVGAWVVAGVLLSTWAATGRPPVPGLPAPGPGAIAPVLVLSVVAAIAGRHGDAAWRAAVPFGLACAVPFLSTLGGGAMDRAARRLGEGAANVVSAVAFGLLGLLVVLVPWVLQRLLRLDPLHGPQGWDPRRRRAVRPQGLWTADPTMSAAPAGPRLRSAAATMAVALVLVALSPPGQQARERLQRRLENQRQGFVLGPATIGSVDDVELDDPVPEDLEEYWPDPQSFDAAHEDDEWFRDPEYSSGQGWILDPKVAWRPVNPYRLLDTRTKYVNIVDGRRASWRPPDCDCRRLTVWVYGGSTTWGLDQRDDHTIPSEIARVAYENGLTVDVQNRGQLGHLHWMEAERFAWDVTADPKPDLVLFYDGVNDSWATNALNDQRSGDMKPMIDPTLVDTWNNSGRSGGTPPARDDVPAGPSGSRFVGRERGTIFSTPELAATTVSRYDRSRALSKTTARMNDIAVRYFWQPQRVSRPVDLEEPHGDYRTETDSRILEQMITDALPKDVVDLTDVLDDVEGPLFTDDVHHNERAARIIAEAIYQDIEDLLRDLADGRSPG